LESLTFDETKFSVLENDDVTRKPAIKKWLNVLIREITLNNNEMPFYERNNMLTSA